MEWIQANLIVSHFSPKSCKVRRLGTPEGRPSYYSTYQLSDDRLMQAVELPGRDPAEPGTKQKTIITNHCSLLIVKSQGAWMPLVAPKNSDNTAISFFPISFLTRHNKIYILKEFQYYVLPVFYVSTATRQERQGQGPTPESEQGVLITAKLRGLGRGSSLIPNMSPTLPLSARRNFRSQFQGIH